MRSVIAPEIFVHLLVHRTARRGLYINPCPVFILDRSEISTHAPRNASATRLYSAVDLAMTSHDVRAKLHVSFHQRTQEETKATRRHVSAVTASSRRSNDFVIAKVLSAGAEPRAA